jgi:dTDP-4-dehydrorhamnose reductase
MRILVLGANGQLGRCLADELHETNHQVLLASRAEIDLSNFHITQTEISRFGPDVVINASAYTAVDKAESDEETAYLINHLAVANIARACRDIDCVLIHVSTDYVFDGLSILPYQEDAATNPMSVYGRSKLKGEIAIQDSGCHYLIVRTAWVFSKYGNNFFKTMMRIGPQNRELRIVGDQFGCPSYAPDIAKALLSTLASPRLKNSRSIYHYAGDSTCTWAEFSKSIFDEAWTAGKLGFKPKIVSIKSKDYPTPAVRPLNSMLDSSRFESDFGFKASPWLVGVRELIDLWDGIDFVG